MSKLIQAILSGLLMTFILAFFLFLGIWLHYIQHYEIDTFFNILFADNQNIYLWIFFTALLGYATLYLHNKIALSLVVVIFCLTLLALIPPIGKELAERVLMKRDISLQTSKFSYRGDIYYDGRREIYFYDYTLQKMLKIEKNRIKELKKL